MDSPAPLVLRDPGPTPAAPRWRLRVWTLQGTFVTGHEADYTQHGFLTFGSALRHIEIVAALYRRDLTECVIIIDKEE